MRVMSPGLSAAGLFRPYHTHWHFGIALLPAAGARGRSAPGTCPSWPLRQMLRRLSLTLIRIFSFGLFGISLSRPSLGFLFWPIWHLAVATLLGISLLADLAPRFRDPLWDFSFGLFGTSLSRPFLGFFIWPLWHVAFAALFGIFFFHLAFAFDILTVYGLNLRPTGTSL